MSRIRSQVLESSFHDWAYSENYTNGRGTCLASPGPPLVTTDFSGTHLKRVHTTQMTDVEVVNFYRLRKQGHIFNNPMTKTEIIEEWTPCTYYRTWGTEKYGCTPAKWYPYIEYEGAGTIDMGNFVALDSNPTYLPSGLDADDISDLRDLAVSKAWSNISQAEVLSYVAVIEMGKTVKGMTQLLKAAHKIMRAGRLHAQRLVKKGEGGFSPSELAEYYMNVRYNLRPLYYDIRGLQKASELQKDGGRQTYRAKKTRGEDLRHTSSLRHFQIVAAPSIAVNTDIERRCTTSAEVHGGVLVDWKNTTMSDKLGGWSIAASAWDLVPYSFICDWFFNVGDTLLSWMPIVGGKVLTSWAVSLVTTTQLTKLGASSVDLTSTSSVYRSAHASYNYSGEMSKTTIVKTRVPRPERPVIPSLDINLDPLKSLDLGIIIKGLFNETNLYKKHRF